jgi:hypothetical protein
LRVGRKSEQRFNEFPAGGHVKSVYVIETPDGIVEQTILRPHEARPPGKGWHFFAKRPRFEVWRRPQP